MDLYPLRLRRRDERERISGPSSQSASIQQGKTAGSTTRFKHPCQREKETQPSDPLPCHPLNPATIALKMTSSRHDRQDEQFLAPPSRLAWTRSHFGRAPVIHDRNWGLNLGMCAGRDFSVMAGGA